MPYSLRKTWQNYRAGGTRLDASGLNDLEARVETGFGDVYSTIQAIYDTIAGGGTGGGGIDDTIYNAKGEFRIGTGNDTAVQVPLGTSGYVWTVDPTNATTGASWLPQSGGSGPVVIQDYSEIANGTSLPAHYPAVQDGAIWRKLAAGTKTSVLNPTQWEVIGKAAQLGVGDPPSTLPVGMLWVEYDTAVPPNVSRIHVGTATGPIELLDTTNPILHGDAVDRPAIGSVTEGTIYISLDTGAWDLAEAGAWTSLPMTGGGGGVSSVLITWTGTEGTSLGATQTLTLASTGDRGLVGTLSADLTVAINSPASGRSFWIDGVQHATAAKRLSLNVGGAGAVEVTDIFSRVPLGGSFVLHGQIGPDGTTAHVTVDGGTGVLVSDLVTTGTPSAGTYLNGVGAWTSSPGGVPLGTWTPITPWLAGSFPASAVAGQYILGVGQNNVLAAAGSALGGAPFWLDPADASGATPVLRFRYAIITTAVAPATDFTFSLRPVTAFNGSSGTLVGIGTVGSAVGATPTVTNPGASTVNNVTLGPPGETADITFPGTAGWYCFVVTTTATIPSTSRPLGMVRLSRKLT